MTLRLRVRTSVGTFTIKGLSADASLNDLRIKVRECAGLDATCGIEIKFGFPPKTIAASEDGQCTVQSLGIQDGEALQVIESKGESSNLQNVSLTAESNPSSLSQAAAQPTRCFPAQEGSVSASTTGTGGDLVGVGLSDGSELVKRVIVSDNSCLFNAVGYVMERNRSASSHLRAVVAKTVASDPFTYNEVFLEKSNEDYCKWILNPQRWGGAIELSILSKYYQREICAYDIQTKRRDVYGQGEGYTERAMVIYDGLHYDALALSAFAGAPEEIDITLFEIDSPICAQASAAAADLVAKLHGAKQFTDTANFTLRCTVCQQGLRGEKEAQEHAKLTGHINFAEY